MSGSVLVRDATDADAKAWNAFLDSRPGSSPLARYEWRPALASCSAQTFFLIAERGGGVAGLLPAYSTVKGRPKKLYSLRGGLIAVDDETATALLASLDEARLRLRAGHASVSANDQTRVVPWPMRRQKTVVLRLSVDEERTWRSMRDKSRNMVRKAQRAGLSVTAEPDALSEFHALYADALLRRGVPAHRLSFLRAAVAGLGEKAELLTAQQSGRMVAGMLLVYGQDSAAYPIQAVTDDFRNSGAVQLLNWEAMRRCIRRGLAVLDMGESREGGSVYASKVNFGGQPSEVFYYDWPPPTTGGVERGPPTARARLDDYLMRKSPLWIRRRYAQRKLELGRLV